MPTWTDSQEGSNAMRLDLTKLVGDNTIITEYSSALPSGGHTDYTADANCQGAWLFADLTDSSGEGNTLADHGTVTFAITTPPAGHTANKYAIFNGTDQYLTRTHTNLSTNFPGKKATCPDMAAAIWVKNTAANTSNTYMGKGIGGGGWEIIHDWITAYQGVIRIENSAWDPAEYKTLIMNDTNWHHVCFSFDGSAKTLRTWLDGAEGVDTVFTKINNVLSYDSGSPSGQDFSIGAKGDGSGFLAGNVYEPIVLDRTISDTEAAEIFTYGITGMP